MIIMGSCFINLWKKIIILKLSLWNYDWNLNFDCKNWGIKVVVLDVFVNLLIRMVKKKGWFKDFNYLTKMDVN